MPYVLTIKKNGQIHGQLGPYAKLRSAAVDAKSVLIMAGIRTSDITAKGKIKVARKCRPGKAATATHKAVKGGSYKVRYVQVPKGYTGSRDDGTVFSTEIAQGGKMPSLKNPRRNCGCGSSSGSKSRKNGFYLTDRDKRVIVAFTDHRRAQGTRVSTNGKQLNIGGLGGSRIAWWEGGKIHMRTSGTKSEQTVQRAVRKEAPSGWLASRKNTAPRRGSRRKQSRKNGTNLVAGTAFTVAGNSTITVADKSPIMAMSKILRAFPHLKPSDIKFQAKVRLEYGMFDIIK